MFNTCFLKILQALMDVLVENLFHSKKVFQTGSNDIDCFVYRPLFQDRMDSDILNPGRVHVTMTGTSSESEEEREERGHFSTFCLSGSDGSVRWHHLPGDFEKKPEKV